MKLSIVAVGNKMPAWVSAAFAEYAKRMPSEAPLALTEIRPEPRGAKPVSRLLEAERARIEAALSPGVRVVALDERGGQLDSVRFAELLEEWMQSGRDVAFLIGGPDGLHPSLKDRAERQLSLSRFTLPHGLARVVLAEQLYRALSIVRHHPYHRA
ncbi:MAG: 23S rRNA (pseudouridine(1915)-N(3))-methyltransferase RlmH [Betaproteobacteria bacterium]|nr:23S rRNA (pseudouridine(1915)-N(3))-methyltransferase RlmH [Betaproteobacteria bacterium]